MILAIISALWLGVLTSISPCPLATNIAAISFLSKDMGKTRRVLSAGLLYTVGRTLTYVIIGMALVYGLNRAPYISFYLQKYMNKLLGPVLIIIGMVMAELLRFNMKSFGFGERLKNRIEAMGAFGAILLGILFAVSFCPMSATLFFGTLATLATKMNSPVMIPAVYGVGTALPVILFSIVVAVSVDSVNKAFHRVTALESWGRRITGCIFIVVGIGYSLVAIFGLNLVPAG